MKTEELSDSVSELFSTIDEKQHFEACRVGKSKSRSAAGPVKFTVSSLMVVIQILYNQPGSFIKSTNSSRHIQVDKFRTQVRTAFLRKGCSKEQVAGDHNRGEKYSKLREICLKYFELVLFEILLTSPCKHGTKI